MSKAKKYRKKPVVIEAMLWDGKATTAFDIARWAHPDGKGGYTGAWSYEGSAPFAMHIPTLEGVMAANQGDYIIKGVKGEFYPCKPDIFEQTYEEQN